MMMETLDIATTKKCLGIGLELQHRIYLHKNDPQPRGAYFGYGTVF